MKRILTGLAFLPLALYLCTACVNVKLKTQYIDFETSRFMWSGKIKGLKISTNGLVSLEGYNASSDETIEAIAAGVVRGMKAAP